MLHKEVSDFNLSAVNQKFGNDLQVFFDDFEAFSKREFTLSEAKIDLDRKTLYHWKKAGLLPFSGSPKKAGENKTWGRFSFIELCWLRMLIDLRALGIGLEKLQNMKQKFFPDDFIDVFFSKPVDTSLINPALRIALEEKNLLENGVLKITPEIRAQFEQVQFSFFSCMLYSLMLTRGNYVIVGIGIDKYEIINLNDILVDPKTGLLDVYNLLSNENTFFISIKKIVADLSNTHNHFDTGTRLGQMMSIGAVEKINELFMSNAVKEVTIKVDNNGTKTVYVKRNIGKEDFEKEVRRITKKGNYCDVMIKTRDGNVQYFEHTEIVKL